MFSAPSPARTGVAHGTTSIEAYVEATVKRLPDLTPEQLNRLGALIGGSK